MSEAEEGPEAPSTVPDTATVSASPATPEEVADKDVPSEPEGIDTVPVTAPVTPDSSNVASEETREALSEAAISETTAANLTAATKEIPQPEPVASVAEPEAEPEATSETAQVDEAVVYDPFAPRTATAEEALEEKYDKGLKKSRRTFGQRLNQLFANFRTVDEDFFEEVEETLIGADVGFDAAMKIADQMRDEVKLQNAKKPKDVQNVIIEKLVNLYDEAGENENHALNLQPGLTVMLFVGVNGVGKTTSIGKMAYEYRMAGKKVLLAAADTFRAGAIDQLAVWGERAGVEVVRHNAGADPAAVVYDAVEKAKNENYDILLVDTAGRLQNKVNLMKELDKIKRVIQREVPDAPHEVLLVVDATTGQNAMVQAKQFKETTDVSGIVLTKLDGTAKGGIVLAIRNELHLPVKLVGLGEGIDDLEPFDPNQFVVGLFKGLLQE
ncbi:signal recognition particle-docking protein FtsY [Enterococcus diestrammenae]|uniref:signal recognition particle-docking protein FtsY n=1 Tax=Enterococcus diestrammenae TaxID=1155073 RepID=UPI003BF6F692